MSNPYSIPTKIHETPISEPKEIRTLVTSLEEAIKTVRSQVIGLVEAIYPILEVEENPSEAVTDGKLHSKSELGQQLESVLKSANGVSNDIAYIRSHVRL